MRPAIRQTLFGGPKVYDFRPGILPPGAVLARADASTCATRVNAQGLIETIPANIARFTFDPVTKGLQGLLVEPTDTNNCTDSENLAGANWSTQGDATISNTAVTSPDGTQDAATVNEGSLTNNRRANFQGVTTVSGSVYPFAVFAKQIAGARWYQQNLGGGAGINLDPAAGTIGSVSAGTVTGMQAVAFGSNWWRFSGLFTSTTTGSIAQRLYMVTASNSANAQSYAGDGASKFALWGVQIGPAAGPITSYVKTVGGVFTRAADVLTLAIPNGAYTAIIERVSGVTTVFGNSVTGGTYTVPTDPSPVRRVTLRRGG